MIYYSMFALSPRSGDYSGAALVVRSVALLHVMDEDEGVMQFYLSLSLSSSSD
jgi:hypothetical protein